MKFNILRSLPLVAALATIATPAFAVVNMSWTTIGNVGNQADPATGGRYGSVDHVYAIGTYEVTNAQYCEFLNAKGEGNIAGIYSGWMGGNGITQSGSIGSYTYSVTNSYQANMPVVGVSWFSAARFCNWLVNGRGGGSMENGAYTLYGATSGIVTVNSGAQVYIPNENEWYKAAYFNGTTATYSLYPNGKNTITTVEANYASDSLADVGYGKASSYGTFGQGGNAWEWTDGPYEGNTLVVRGGGCSTNDRLIGLGYGTSLQSLNQLNLDPSSTYFNSTHSPMGFRVARLVQSPLVTTGSGTTTTTISVILEGTVNPNGFPTTAQFECGLTADYGSVAGVTLSPTNGSSVQTVSANISGLQPAKTYHYRLIATNAGGTSTGEDMTFLTCNVLTISTLHGTVPGAGGYVQNGTVQLTPTPDPGYVFSKWTGDATGKDNPLSLLVDSSKTITAVFGPDGRDSDGDGLTNYQEIVVYGTNPNVADTDGDGYLDGYEVQTGHAPLDPLDAPPLVAEARTAIEFTFSSTIGKTYRIEDSPDMANWSVVESAITGNGAIIQRFYTTRNVAQRYFRVAVE